MAIWKHLGLEKLSPEERAGVASSETETVRKIVAALNQWEPERARFIAAFAYLLSRVANADQNISEEDTRVMERIVMEHGGLPEEQALGLSLRGNAFPRFLSSKAMAGIVGADLREKIAKPLIFQCGFAGAAPPVLVPGFDQSPTRKQ